MQSRKEAGVVPALENLELEGIDLEAYVDDSRIVPGEKSGTVLDDFEIDLADLLEE